MEAVIQNFNLMLPAGDIKFIKTLQKNGLDA
jgi:hypothetical protein